jgi:hypothetical protein
LLIDFVPKSSELNLAIMQFAFQPNLLY